MTIVDLGCGVGTLDFYLASKGIRVVGIDASEIAIRAAKVNAKALNLSSKTKFIKQDLNKKISGKYDAALLTEVIEHLENEEEVLRLSNKLLKKGGLLIISTRASSAPLYKFNLAKLHDKRVGHIRRYTINKLNELVLAAGFKVVEKGKAEGLLRDFLFSFPKIGSQIVRMANKFGAVSDSLMFVDNICVKMFGESQIYLVAKK
jgi:cyclopropane fatty-acyl-phospholipid synthase-like methyltransferase